MELEPMSANHFLYLFFELFGRDIVLTTQPTSPPLKRTEPLHRPTLGQPPGMFLSLETRVGKTQSPGSLYASGLVKPGGE